MKRTITIILIAGLALIVLIQFIPVHKDNPEIAQKSVLQAPAPVEKILRRSCYDCHSFETEWPWYSAVAPVSWFVSRDVNEGREHLNFSIWNEYPPEAKIFFRNRILHEIEAGAMPLPVYLIMHSEARIDDLDLEAVRGWIQTDESD